jgi:fumarate reductase subunit C
MHGKTAGRSGYIRPMQGWWRRDPFFMRYMAYAVILMWGAVRLAQGEAAWNAWLQALRSPWSILLHLVLLAAMVVHAQSWFAIMPKTMPMLFLRGHRVGQETITRFGWAATVVASLALVAMAWGSA